MHLSGALRQFVHQPLLPSHLPGRTHHAPLSHLPEALIQPGPMEGKSCFPIVAKFIPVLKEQTVFLTCLPSAAEAYSSINNKQSTFPSVPADFIEQSQATRRQRLWPGRSPRSQGCCIGLTGEEKGGSPQLQHCTQLHFAVKHKAFLGGMQEGQQHGWMGT